MLLMQSLMLINYVRQALYFYLLRKHKEDITQRLNPQHKVNDDAYKSLEFLFKSYEPQYWYWEVVETGRRLFFTFLLQFGQASINTQVRCLPCLRVLVLF